MWDNGSRSVRVKELRMWLELGWGRDEPSGDSLDKGKHFVAGQKEQKNVFQSVVDATQLYFR
jgi:hypothetical protein